MKLTDVFAIVTRCIADIDAMPTEENFKKADSVAKLSKQACNIADITLRADKLTGDFSRIDTMVGRDGK